MGRGAMIYLDLSYRRMLGELSQFGLNPDDWRIIKVDYPNSVVFMENIEDRRFSLSGKVSSGGNGALSYWRELSFKVA